MKLSKTIITMGLCLTIVFATVFFTEIKKDMPSNNTTKAISLEQSSSKTSDYIYNNGEFKGYAKGYNGTVGVSIIIKNDTIAKAYVFKHNEDLAYFNKCKSLLNEVVENQSTNIDGVSGCTFTSNGILNAINDALSKGEK